MGTIPNVILSVDLFFFFFENYVLGKLEGPYILEKIGGNKQHCHCPPLLFLIEVLKHCDIRRDVEEKEEEDGDNAGNFSTWGCGCLLPLLIGV